MPSVLASERRRALVRGIPGSFETALCGFFGQGEPDVERAQEQHAAYVAALRELGVDVVELPADEAHPDCCFVEDQVVILGDQGLLTSVGHPSRVGEQRVVAEALEPHITLSPCPEDATLDGGDVVRVGHRLLVGLSSRTNAAGAEALARFAEGAGLVVIPIELPGRALHLGSICSSPTPDLLIVPEGWLPMEPLVALEEDGVSVMVVPEEEVYGCNTLAVGPSVLVADGYPSVAQALLDRGLDLVVLDMSEIRAVDGSLTCLSVFY